jgi:hypothetical protein
MFTPTSHGYMNMTCAAWTGVTYFKNDVKIFGGNFTIDGTMTDWEGNYTLKWKLSVLQPLLITYCTLITRKQHQKEFKGLITFNSFFSFCG